MKIALQTLKCRPHRRGYRGVRAGMGPAQIPDLEVSDTEEGRRAGKLPRARAGDVHSVGTADFTMKSMSSAYQYDTHWAAAKETQESLLFPE